MYVHVTTRKAKVVRWSFNSYLHAIHRLAMCVCTITGHTVGENIHFFFIPGLQMIAFGRQYLKPVSFY